MKKLTLILLSILMIVTLAACGNKCEHTYDNDCDAICNECEETREVQAHQWKDATCTTLKTCTVCGTTEGEMLTHEWTTPDVDACEVQSTCSVCGATDGATVNHTYDNACDASCNNCGATRTASHTPENDDNDCSTALNCGVCGEEILAAGEHSPEKDDGNCTTAQKCTVCGQTAVDAKAEHTDADHDYLCDNAGCQISVNPPEDPNPGIDLPIDTNN